MDKQAYYMRFKRFQQSHEKKYTPQFFKAIKEQYNQFLTAYRKGGNADNSLLAVNLVPIAPVLQELYNDAALTYGAKILADFNKLKASNAKARIPMGFSQRMRDLMLQYYYSEILQDAEEISQTTRETIQKYLAEATLNGYGIDWIEEQLMKSDITQVRARRIALTETVTAANQGAIIAAKESGLKVKKEWLATMDHRTRRDHLTADGQVVDMDGYFTVGTENVTMSQPGGRIQQNGLQVPAKEIVNCRCTVIFNPVRDSRGRLVEA